MFLSQYLLPTQKEHPKDAAIISHKLMLRAGLIKQSGVGLYYWLPLGLKVLKKIENIIRNEMNNIGALEVTVPLIQPISLWKQSGRYGVESELSSEMLVIDDRSGTKFTFAPTAEEAICDLLKNCIQSYNDLPKNIYQIGLKFRDEIRPRFGVMRAREFYMKDAYTFDIDEPSARANYDKVFAAYIKIFKMIGLNAIPVKADTGDMGGDLSHEFHILADTGESTIFYEDGLEEYLSSNEVNIENYNKFYANEENKHDEVNCAVPSNKLMRKKGIEVGHIFYLGDKYSKSMDITLQDQNGKIFHPKMGCYGIGLSRLVAAAIEASNDEKGIIWQQEISPFDMIIVNLKIQDETCVSIAQDLYDVLRANGKDVLYDDTNASMGVKLARAELVGIPWIIIVGPKFAQNNMVEVKQRSSGEVHCLTVESAKSMFIQSNTLD